MERYIKIYVDIFIITSGLLFILISIYYILPNNYELYTEAREEIFKRVGKKRVKGKIEYEEIRGNYIKFNKDSEIILDNKIKSDGIRILKDQYIKVYNDCDIYIKDGEKEITIYKLKN
jgi:hypothetical protein